MPSVQQGTANVVELARGFRNLRAFVHMSAALPSPHLCSAALREERVYTLTNETGGNLDCRQVAVELQHLPADLAAAKVGPHPS